MQKHTLVLVLAEALVRRLLALLDDDFIDLELDGLPLNHLLLDRVLRD